MVKVSYSFKEDCTLHPNHPEVYRRALQRKHFAPADRGKFLERIGSNFFTFSNPISHSWITNGALFENPKILLPGHDERIENAVSEVRRRP